MLKSLYRYEALPPVNPRVKQITPEVPQDLKMSVSGNRINLSWEPGANNQKFVLYRLRRGKAADVESAKSIVLITGETTVSLDLNRENNPEKNYFVLSAISPTNIESVVDYFK